MKSLFTIKAFNPHEATHPGHKVVCEETLTLIKLLRDQGNIVVVEPDDGRPVEYLFRKGFSSFFSDPLVISAALGIASSAVATLITDSVKWIWQHRRKEHIFKSAPTLTTILLKNSEDGTLFSYSGKPVDASALERLVTMVKRQGGEFRSAARAGPPYPGLDIPIFLEHTAQLVGWCDLKCNETGLFSERAYFTDKQVLSKVIRGELRGMSITGIAQESKCSVCGTSYIECNHISGIEYDSVLCMNEIVRAILINVNLVARPVNRDCYVQMMRTINQES